MAPKHLHELLADDQEPFFLHANISDRRRKLNMPSWPLIHRKPISFGESFLNSCLSSSSFQYHVPKIPVPLPPQFGAPAMNDAILEEEKIGDYGSKGWDLADGKKQGMSAAGTGMVEILFRTLTKLGRRSGKRESSHDVGGGRVQVRDILRHTISNPGDVLKQEKANTSKIQSSRGSCSTSESSDAPSGTESREGRESLKVAGKSSFHCPTPESQSATGSLSHYELEDKDDAEEVPTVEKEQSSPVSVLDPPSFEANTEEHDYEDVDGYRLEYMEGLDHETSPSRGIGTNQMLLRNIYMFQKRLLGIDLDVLEEELPVEQDGDARKRMVTKGMMKMVSDLIVGEQKLKQTVDEMGLRRRDHGLEDTAKDIEHAILGVLVEELLS